MGDAGGGNPTAAMLVIGDEILSGRTRDANMHHLAGRLTEAGIRLIEVRVVTDEHAAIVAAVRELRERAEHVFTSGGIGPTHDDITAEAVAEALGAEIGVRDDARAILEAHYARSGGTLNEARLRMARIPAGAELIDNPVSAAPGFSLGGVHVMAGVPQIFEAMVAGLLPRLRGGRPLISRTVRVTRGEGDIAEVLTDLQAGEAGIAVGSYPFVRNGEFGVNVVLRGPEAETLDRAAGKLLDAFGDDAMAED